MLIKFFSPAVPALVAFGFIPGAHGGNGIPRAPAEGGHVKPVSELPVKSLQAVDMEKVAEEDEETRANSGAPRFATVENVHITPLEDGEWEENDTLWRHTFRAGSDDCKFLAFGFTRFNLADDMELFIYDADSNVLDDADDSNRLAQYTSQDNNKRSNQLWTAPFPSCHVVIELDLDVPVPKQDIELTLSVVSVGYKDIGSHDHVDRDLSGSCNRDVVCSDGNNWRNEIASVGFMTFTTSEGSFVCTGAMINNAEEDRKNLFLTANHCISTEAVADTLVVYWNYETGSCGGNPNGSLQQKQNGAQVLETYKGSDVTLLLLDSSPQDSWKVAYAGWDKSGAAATKGVVGIHHPSGDEKRISIENGATKTTNYYSNTAQASATHIRVENWDVGTTEGGSSGSPLFDHNHRVIGQLHGGDAACQGNSNNGEPDWYGRFSVSWDNANLAKHLDPNNKGVSVMNTLPHGSSGGSNPTPTPAPAPAQNTCGDNSIGGSEVCDGTADFGKSCGDFEGFLSGVGTIGCLFDCSGADTTKCRKTVREDTGISKNEGESFVGTVNVDYPISWIKFEISGGSGDADLYVKLGSAPTESDYGCRPYRDGNSEACSPDGTAGDDDLIAAKQGVYHFMMLAYTKFSGVTLKVTTDGVQVGASSGGGGPANSVTSSPTRAPVAAPSSVCGDNQITGSEVCDGTNIQTTCAAQNFLSGVGEIGCLSDCSAVNTTKCHKLVREDTNISKKKKKSFKRSVTIDHPTSFVEFKIFGGSGDADLYVKFGSEVTKSNYDCRPYSDGNSEACSSNGDADEDTLIAAKQGVYYIMVHAYEKISGVTLQVVADGVQG